MQDRPEHLLGGQEAAPPSACSVRDEELKGEIVRIWGDNLEVYGADIGLGPRTQIRSVSWLIASFAAIHSMAFHCDGYSH